MRSGSTRRRIANTDMQHDEEEEEELYVFACE